MNIRAASFRDLARIEQLHREAAAREEGEASLSSGSPVPQTALVRLWYAFSRSLSSLVPLTESGDVLYVAEDVDGSIVGFLQAQAAPRQARAWQVVNLCVAPTGRGHFAGEPLLNHLCRQGMERGVTRFVARVPDRHPLTALFLEHGFTQYVTEQILFRDDSGATPRVVGDAGPLRPARRDDLGAVYLLYLRTTPSHVANLEGPNQKTWQAGFHQGWMDRFCRDDVRHFVAEQPGVVAWVAVRPSTQAQPVQLALMCEGLDAGLRDQVVEAALAQVPPGPVSCVLRHYDSELIRSLQRHGFEILGTQLVLVRDLALRVRLRQAARAKSGVLVRAGLARSVPADPNPALRPSTAPAGRRPQPSR